MRLAGLDQREITAGSKIIDLGLGSGIGSRHIQTYPDPELRLVVQGSSPRTLANSYRRTHQRDTSDWGPLEAK